MSFTLTELFVENTAKFSVFSNRPSEQRQLYIVAVCLNCEYTSSLVYNAVIRRANCYYSDNLNLLNSATSSTSLLSAFDNKPIFCIQVCDFENISWDVVLQQSSNAFTVGNSSINSVLYGASSYLVRKGLSRKAQLSLQLRRYTCKNPNSILGSSVPYTVIVETWNAFEDMKVTKKIYNVAI
jgi:hypothetical protein